jgi:hypothetical protein
MAGEEKIVGKITVRDIGLSAAKCEELVADGSEPTIMQIVGKTSGYTKKPSTLGGDKMSFGFIGKFRAQNAITGEVYRAGKCFLPEIAELQLADEIDNAKDKDDNAIVEFGFNLGLQQNKSTKPNASKYKFTVIPLFAPSEESDPLAQLMKKVKALPAPKA